MPASRGTYPTVYSPRSESSIAAGAETPPVAALRNATEKLPSDDFVSSLP